LSSSGQSFEVSSSVSAATICTGAKRSSTCSTVRAGRTPGEHHVRRNAIATRNFLHLRPWHQRLKGVGSPLRCSVRHRVVRSRHFHEIAVALNQCRGTPDATHRRSACTRRTRIASRTPTIIIMRIATIISPALARASRTVSSSIARDSTAADATTRLDLDRAAMKSRTTRLASSCLHLESRCVGPK
jgi:hypothetical protein